MKKRLIYVILLTVTSLLMGCSYSDNKKIEHTLATNIENPSDNNDDNVTEDVILEEKEPEYTEVTIGAIGDMLIHNTVYQSMKTSKGYDFHPMFKDIAPFTNSSDFTIANLETVFGGAEMTYSNYPMFNSPEQLGYALKNTLGVDLLTTNNNHSLDRGIKGLNKTLEFLDEYELDSIGTYASKEDSENPYIQNINGANIAFVSYTYGTNGNPIPEGNEYSVSLIDKEKILNDCKIAEEAGADFIVTLLHWGVEYQHEPSKEQRDLATWVFENTNSSLIIGNHPHVVQPIEEIIVEKNGQEKKGIVCYALGNFTGNQNKEFCDTGIAVEVSLKINLDEPFSEQAIQQVSYFPTYIDENSFSTGQGYRTLNAYQAMYDYENGLDSLLSQNEYNLMKKYAEFYEDLVPRSSLVVESSIK